MKRSIILLILLILPLFAGAWQDAPAEPCQDLVYLETIYNRINEELENAPGDKVLLAGALYDLVDLRWQLVEYNVQECAKKVKLTLILYLDYQRDSAILGFAHVLDGDNDPRYRILAENQYPEMMQLAAMLESAFE